MVNVNKSVILSIFGILVVVVAIALNFSTHNTEEKSVKKEISPAQKIVKPVKILAPIFGRVCGFKKRCYKIYVPKCVSNLYCEYAF